MTAKSRPVDKRARRRPAAGRDARRTLILNIAFVLAIVGSLSILGAVAFANWYGQHWASIASVNGHSISKDDVDARARVDNARLSEQLLQYTKLRNESKITADDFTTLQSQITSAQSKQTLYQNALTELQNEALILDYADKNGLSPTDAQVKAQIDKDATVPEMRHIKVIGIEPQAADGSFVPTSTQLDASQQQAQAFLDQIKGGKAWDDVAKTANAAYLQGTVGDLGLNSKDGFANGSNSSSPTPDPQLLDAAFGLQKVNDITPVIKCADGIFRFATVTEISPAERDPNWEANIGKSASLGSYNYSARAAAAKALVKAKVEQQYIQSPTKQRHVLEFVALQGSASQSGQAGDEVKSRIAVFAPNKSAANAASVADTDPAWNDAKKRADDFYNSVKDNASQFLELSKNSDDPAWGWPAGTPLPFLDQSVFSNNSQQGGVDLAPVGDELFKADVKVDQIFAPVKTTQGYIVAQFVSKRASAEARMNAAKLMINSGTSFEDEAKAASDAPDAPDGGDMGWIARYQLSPDLETAIFATPVGQTSQVVSSGGASYMFKILDEQVRTPDAKQARKMQDSVFNNWLNELDTKATKTSDPNGLDQFIGSSAAPSQ